MSRVYILTDVLDAAVIPRKLESNCVVYMAVYANKKIRIFLSANFAYLIGAPVLINNP